MTNKKHNKLSHPCFIQPENLETKVWRFMDLSKFIDLLSRKHLFLSRLDLLGDSYEGSITKAFYYARNESLIKNGFGDLIIHKEYISKNSIQSTFINCWYFNDFESEAMWKIYCPNNQGVAIQTTYKKLVKSIEYDDFLYVGPVKYVDYETEMFPDDNTFYPIMHKRKAFEFEKEVRLVKTIFQNWKDKPYEPPVGIHTPWNIQEFCDRIYVNPYAKDWYHDLVYDILKKYGFDIKLEWSTQKGKPFY